MGHMKLQIWDTAGQERYHTIAPQFYRNVKACLLVYDVCNEKSFMNVRRWAAQIHAHRSGDAVVMLVGNKADMDARMVDEERGRALAEELGMPFIETSAKEGTNVAEAFQTIAEAVRRRLPMENLEIATSTEKYVKPQGTRRWWR